MYRFQDIYVYVMYYVYVTSGPSLLIESTDYMMMGIIRVSFGGGGGGGGDGAICPPLERSVPPLESKT